MTYSITGLPVEPFRRFFGLGEAAPAAHQIVRVVADAPSGYPCRVLLEDAATATARICSPEFGDGSTRAADR